jgi:hypothetical protein
MNADMTFCLGEGSAGHVCRKREDCRRYRYRNAKPVDGTRFSYAAMLCRYSDFEYRIPMEREREG